MGLSWISLGLTDIGKNWFTNRVVDEWNTFSSHVVSANTINTFKKSLDKFINGGHGALVWFREPDFILRCLAELLSCRVGEEGRVLDGAVWRLT